MTNRKYTCLLVVLSCFGLCGGCAVYVFWPNHTTQLFGYDGSTANYEGFRVRISALGNWRTTENLTVQGSSYDVLVCVRFDGEPQSVLLERVRLLTSDKKRIALDEDNIAPREPELGSDGKYSTGYWLMDREFAYEDYVAVLDLVLELDGQTTRKQVELPLERDYREYRTSRLMRVLQR